jgi:hypothetical protein
MPQSVGGVAQQSALKRRAAVRSASRVARLGAPPARPSLLPVRAAGATQFTTQFTFIYQCNSTNTDSSVSSRGASASPAPTAGGAGREEEEEEEEEEGEEGDEEGLLGGCRGCVGGGRTEAR